jgi:hypothetical protein
MGDVIPAALDGVICSPEELELAKKSAAIYCLTRGQSIGLLLASEAGLISLVAVLVVFLLIYVSTGSCAVFSYASLIP